ncbi:transposase [Neolewinella litorea]|uniref:Transposase IS200-like domain-containing protein n=1 Tax=Neolewinella litorea TaxID=2562452 RepID=A0A4S4NHR4_9BACT|nr:transposase [Neolewinella litorea]THH37741.1 hypothetical protein E4021_13690 [Neolewinella litorea]
MSEFGKLPHRPLRHIPMHIVYRLSGSIPQKVLTEMREKYWKYQEAYGEAQTPFNEPGPRILAEQLLEEALHHKSNGPYHLANPAIAKLVLDSWKWLAEHRGVMLFAICVMSNHVHVLARSSSEAEVDTGSIIKAHKNFTALRANRILGIRGQPFWATSYFDRDVRTGKFSTVMWYLLNNPVKAGLVKHWEDWPHTYLHPDYDLLFRRCEWEASAA